MQRDERVQREQQCYDSGNVFSESAKLQSRFNHVFESRNTRYGGQHFTDTLAESCPGAVVLDYGCLNGTSAPIYRSYGAQKILGIDISENGIASAIQNYGDIAEFRICDAHNLEFLENDTIDLIVGTAILHHLEFEQAIKEVVRVLKKGGKALFVEPLYDNPASKLFRRLTPSARTSDERPLSRNQIEWANSQFASGNHRFYNLVTTPIAMLTSLLPLSASNPLLHIADIFDRKLERTALKYWMRQVVLLWQK
jgi:ubiquinone/menaquinone biosynthesis C-methylase UbiE